jgi:hypothetical protein
MASPFDNIAMRFEQHNLHTVEFLAYDVYPYGLPETLLDIGNVPSIYIFPAIRKLRELVKIPYEDSYYLKINFLIDFVLDNVDLKFVVPERLHLAPANSR